MAYLGFKVKPRTNKGINKTVHEDGSVTSKFFMKTVLDLRIKLEYGGKRTDVEFIVHRYRGSVEFTQRWPTEQRFTSHVQFRQEIARYVGDANAGMITKRMLAHFSHN